MFPAPLLHDHYPKVANTIMEYLVQRIKLPRI